jgi:hypothetical protein
MTNKDKKELASQDGTITPHVGSLVLQTVTVRKVYKAALARAINKHISTLLNYFDRPSLQTSVLWELSIIMKHNFFTDIAAQLPDTFAGPQQQTLADKDAEIERLQQEIERLKADKELLLQVMKK